MRAASFAIVFSALAAACSSSSSEPQPLGARRVAEPAELVVSGSCRHQEDTLMLAIAVMNRGRGAAAPTAARVEVNADASSSIVRQTGFIPAHAVHTFEVELPAVCSKIACRWNVTVDSARPARESGHC